MENGTLISIGIWVVIIAIIYITIIIIKALRRDAFEMSWRDWHEFIRK